MVSRRAVLFGKSLRRILYVPWYRSSLIRPRALVGKKSEESIAGWNSNDYHPLKNDGKKLFLLYDLQLFVTEQIVNKQVFIARSSSYMMVPAQDNVRNATKIFWHSRLARVIRERNKLMDPLVGSSALALSSRSRIKSHGWSTSLRPRKLALFVVAPRCIPWR